MSMFTKLPSEFYDVTAFDGFSPDRDFHLGTAKAMAWLSQLAYETDEPKKIEAILRIWKLRLVEEVISTELRSVLPMASTHAFVAAGRGATFIPFAGTDPIRTKRGPLSVASEPLTVDAVTPRPQSP